MRTRSADTAIQRLQVQIKLQVMTLWYWNTVFFFLHPYHFFSLHKYLGRGAKKQTTTKKNPSSTCKNQTHETESSKSSGPGDSAQVQEVVKSLSKVLQRNTEKVYIMTDNPINTHWLSVMLKVHLITT